jgi:hypothetical protein
MAAPRSFAIGRDRQQDELVDITVEAVGGSLDLVAM